MQRTEGELCAAAEAGRTRAAEGNNRQDNFSPLKSDGSHFSFREKSWRAEQSRSPSVVRPMVGIERSGFQHQLEDGLSKSRAIAVFVGKDGLGVWEEMEFRAAFMEKLRETDTPIIPVLLPGASAVYKGLPPFLRSRAYVDLGDDPENYQALSILIAGIEGIKPDEIILDKVQLDPESRPIARPLLGALQAQTIRAYNRIADQFTSKWFDHPPG